MFLRVQLVIMNTKRLFLQTTRNAPIGSTGRSYVLAVQVAIQLTCTACTGIVGTVEKDDSSTGTTASIVSHYGRVLNGEALEVREHALTLLGKRGAPLSPTIKTPPRKKARETAEEALSSYKKYRGDSPQKHKTTPSAH